MATKKVVILGSTGSVGRQALEVIEARPDRFEVVGLVAGSDEQTLADQAARHPGADTGLGAEPAEAVAGRADADIVLNAITGAAGLKASLAALGAGKLLALANKESLVAGGELCVAAATSGGGSIVAVDSEHAALAQCLAGVDRTVLARVHLTASGGPFRARADLSDVTPDEALAHPTWSMGPKITIDSATLMNKGLEVIEAHFLFDIDYDDIGVVVHPQSVVHAMAELVDGSLIMQAAPADMRIPIQAAVSHPDRLPSLGRRLDPRSLGSLTFEPLDAVRFPAVVLAYEVGRRGGTFPAVMNAANEVAVAAFLEGNLSFPGIWETTAEVVERHESLDPTDLGDVLRADAWARAEARALMTRHPVVAQEAL
ncbi:MAG TPA: 1-deoxy-D-xylulose-5-phosphate reductoisomerase [Actinomycetota bacterium]|nr:1-deoxy-D-xylulose-5-phosphate reductoisomerase [Actinomycetota bacterium]